MTDVGWASGKAVVIAMAHEAVVRIPKLFNTGAIFVYGPNSNLHASGQRRRYVVGARFGLQDFGNIDNAANLILQHNLGTPRRVTLMLPDSRVLLGSTYKASLEEEIRARFALGSQTAKLSIETFLNPRISLGQPSIVLESYSTSVGTYREHYTRSRLQLPSSSSDEAVGAAPAMHRLEHEIAHESHYRHPANHLELGNNTGLGPDATAAAMNDLVAGLPQPPQHQSDMTEQELDDFIANLDIPEMLAGEAGGTFPAYHDVLPPPTVTSVQGNPGSTETPSVIQIGPGWEDEVKMTQDVDLRIMNLVSRTALLMWCRDAQGLVSLFGAKLQYYDGNSFQTYSSTLTTLVNLVRPYGPIFKLIVILPGHHVPGTDNGASLLYFLHRSVKIRNINIFNVEDFDMPATNANLDFDIQASIHNQNLKSVWYRVAFDPHLVPRSVVRST